MNPLDAILASVAFERSGVVRVRDERYAEHDPRRVASLLAARLYSLWYCCRRPVVDRSNLLVSLRDANAVRSRWESGWRVGADAGDGKTWIHRGGCARRVPIADVRGPWVHRRADAYDAGGTWYHALGSMPESDALRLRIYFHVAPSQGPRLVRALTRRLERWQVPFRLKLPAVASDYGRTDAAVLYVEWSRFQFVLELIRDALLTGEFGLEEETPLFAFRLAPGLAFAEDPRNGESFGSHRCRLLAEALTLAGYQGIADPAIRRDLVRSRFEVEGISWDAPHLESGTADPLRDHHERRRVP